MNVNSLFSKYSYLFGTVQFSFFFFFFAWWGLHLKKNPCSLSTNSAYYCHERAHQQIYQFHLEGVVLATAFVSKSELFEDKHGIIQSAGPPCFPPRLLPSHSPTSKQRGLDEGLERNGKQIVHLYLGGDQTLEQILPAFSARCAQVMLRCCAREPERGKAPEIAVFKGSDRQSNV